MSINPKHPIQPSGVQDLHGAEQKDQELGERVSEALATLVDLARHDQSRTLLCTCRQLMEFDARRLALVHDFVHQTVEIHDPDVVATFLGWKSHPVLDSILLLAAKLNEDQQYQLLDLAEELYGQNRGVRGCRR
ncbi:MAG TPA: hypothetical protein VHG92_07530 [Afifellaceae bacterium]|nr:hypothetical protein [Afifellaceae bacterium]